MIAGNQAHCLELIANLPHNGPRSMLGDAMPSLFRFLVLCAVLAGIAYGAMFALVLYVQPTEREVTIRIPAQKLNP